MEDIKIETDITGRELEELITADRNSIWYPGYDRPPELLKFIKGISNSSSHESCKVIEKEALAKGYTYDDLGILVDYCWTDSHGIGEVH